METVRAQGEGEAGSAMAMADGGQQKAKERASESVEDIPRRRSSMAGPSALPHPHSPRFLIGGWRSPWHRIGLVRVEAPLRYSYLG